MPEWLFILTIFIVSGTIAWFSIRPLGLKVPAQSILILLCWGFLILCSYHWSNAPSWYAFQEQQAQQEQVKKLLQSNPGRGRILALMQEKLKKNPESAKGWYLLGRLYAGEGRWREARDAFAKSVYFEAENEAYQVNYAQSLWQLNQQVFNPMIRTVFQNLYKKNPRQPDTLAMLALDSFQQKNYQKAIEYWELLLRLLPAESEDSRAIRKAIAKARQFI